MIAPAELGRKKKKRINDPKVISPSYIDGGSTGDVICRPS